MQTWLCSNACVGSPDSKQSGAGTPGYGSFHIEKIIKNFTYIIGIPDLDRYMETVLLSLLINQKGRTPEALVAGRQWQKLSQSHLDHQRQCSALKGIHNVVNKEAPVHPHNREKNNDPDTHSCHTPGREYNLQMGSSSGSGLRHPQHRRLPGV
eukprot:1158225-Amphidinium_carterae.2